jgi:type IV pilus assembly protein PilE
MSKRKHDDIGSRKQKGVTLLELMVVVAIIGIISAIAYPSYTQFVVKSKRATGSGMLLQIADRQQQYFLDNKRFATKFSSLGYASDDMMINDDGMIVSASNARRTYKIALSGATAAAYTIEAAPQLGQATNDTDCGTITLTSAGIKGQTGTGENCW